MERRCGRVRSSNWSRDKPTDSPSHHLGYRYWFVWDVTLHGSFRCGLVWGVAGVFWGLSAVSDIYSSHEILPQALLVGQVARAVTIYGVDEAARPGLSRFSLVRGKFQSSYEPIHL